MKARLRQVLCALLALLTLASCARAADAYAGYADLQRGAWYEPGARYCIKRELMCGYRNFGMHFYPEEPVTRAQLVTMLWRLEGQPKTGLTTQYLDIPEGSWYEDAVRWALAEDIMGGTSITSFSPDMPVTRERLASALHRYTLYRFGEAPVLPDPAYEHYTDRDKVSADCDEAMRWAFGLGLILGMTTKDGVGYLTPWAVSTRAVTATVLMRYCIDFSL